MTPEQSNKPEEWQGTNTLNRQIARARKSMGPARWAQLNREWESKS